MSLVAGRSVSARSQLQPRRKGLLTKNDSYLTHGTLALVRADFVVGFLQTKWPV
jgi:hypothetical protein